MTQKKIKYSQVDAGINPNQIVVLDSLGRMPAVDGSLLIGVPAVTSLVTDLNPQLGAHLDLNSFNIITLDVGSPASVSTESFNFVGGSNSAGAGTFTAGGATLQGGFGANGNDGGPIVINGGNSADGGYGGYVSISSGTGTLTSGAGTVSITGGNSSNSAFAGGAVSITSGDNVAASGSAVGGDIDLTAGDSNASTSGNGGYIGIYAGAGGNRGGKVFINGGDSSGTNSAGSVNLKGGANTSTGNGGSLVLTGGASTASTGGNVIVQSGLGASAGGYIGLLPNGPGAYGGEVRIKSNNTSAIPEVQFYEAILNGGQSVALKAPISIGSSVTWTLPQDSHINANGKFLTSDGSGVLSFSTVSTVAALNDLTDVVVAGSPLVADQVLTFNGTDWVNAVASGGGASALGDLTDVIVAGSPLVTDQVLTFDGTNWINAGTAGEANKNWIVANGSVDFATTPLAAFSNSIAIGNASSTSNRTSSIAFGDGAIALQHNAIVIGTGAANSGTSGNGSVSIGFGSIAADYSVAIGTSAHTAYNNCTAIGNGAKANGGGAGRKATALGAQCEANGYGQISVGYNCDSTSTTTDVSYSVKLGHGTAGVNKNMLHIYDKGKLELYGDEAQFVMPTYAVGGSPNNYPANSVEGGLVFDSVNDVLKVYNGASWGDVSPAGGGSTKPQFESFISAGSPPSEIINTTVPTVAIGGSPQLAGVQVFRNGMVQDEGVDIGSPATITEDFVVSGANQITFAPTILKAGDKIKIFAFT